MPRPRKNTPAPNAVIASAARVMATRTRGTTTPTGGNVLPWQAEAWAMLDAVGELEFYREWKANALSRCTLRVVEQTGVTPEGEPIYEATKDAAALNALAVLFGGEAGQAQMLAMMEGHIAIVGETWLVGLIDLPTDPDIDQWRVLAHTEIQRDGAGGWKIDRGDGQVETYSDEEVYAVRIWEPHPARWAHATSSVRGAMPILRELVGRAKADAATIDSRLAGAGLLAVPEEITFAAPAEPDGDGQDPALDPFLAALTETMLTAIADRADASAVVPIVVKAPAEHLDKIKHIPFTVPFDEKNADRVDRLIKRLATSLGAPAEVLTGMADVNHWTGWLLDDNAIKMHIEPDLQTLTHGLTTRWLWPVLQGAENPTFDPALRRFRIIGDTSDLRARPNHAAEAQTGWAALAFTDAAMARETGFDEGDLLDPNKPEHAVEFRRRVLLQAVQSGNPDLAVAAMKELGIDLTASMPAPAPAPAVGAPGTPPALEPPAAPSGNVRALPQQPQQDRAAAALAASELIVMRAVERAWNKAGKRGRTRTSVAAEHIDLAGAWDYVPRLGALLALDADGLQEVLDGYTRTLLVTGANHDPAALGRALLPLLTTG